MTAKAFTQTFLSPFDGVFKSPFTGYVGTDPDLVYQLITDGKVSSLVTEGRTTALWNIGKDRILKQNPASTPTLDYNPWTGRLRGLMSNVTVTGAADNNTGTASMFNGGNITASSPTTVRADGTTGQVNQWINNTTDTNEWWTLGDAGATLSAANVKFSMGAFIKVVGDPTSCDQIRISWRFNDWDDVCGVRYHPNTGRVTPHTNGGGTVGKVETIPLPNGWIYVAAHDCESTGGFTSGSMEGYLYSGDGSTGFQMYGLNLVESPEYVPQVLSSGSDATVTRSEVSVNFPDENWELPMTVFIEAGKITDGDSVSNVMLEMRNAVNSTDERVTFKNNSSRKADLEVVSASSYQAQIQSTDVVPEGVFNKFAFVIAEDDVVLYMNGANQGSDTNGTMPDLSKFYVGNPSWSGWQFNGWIKQIEFYKGRKSNSWLAAKTTKSTKEIGYGPNLILDGDFESEYSNWGTGGSTTHSIVTGDDALAGTKSLKGTAVDGNFDRIEYSVNGLTVGKEYEFEALIENNALGGFQSWTVATISAQGFENPTAAVETIRFTATSTAGLIRLYCSKDGTGSTSDYIIVDNVKLREVLKEDTV